MAKYYTIDGYWKDDKSEFGGHIVKDTHDVEAIEEDSVFLYGLSEKDIKEAIELGENTVHDFVILDYREI